MSQYAGDLGFQCDRCGAMADDDVAAAFWTPRPDSSGATAHLCDRCAPRDVVTPSPWIMPKHSPLRLACARCHATRDLPTSAPEGVWSRHLNVFARIHNGCKVVGDEG